MKIVKRIFLILLILVLIIVSYTVFRGYSLYKDAMNEASLEDRIAAIKNDEHFVPISELPKYYKDAVVAIEDHRFYSHHGVDIVSTMRAVIKNIQAKELVEGRQFSNSASCKKFVFFSRENFL